MHVIIKRSTARLSENLRVVVAGGYYGEVEIYSMNDGFFSYGTNMPMALTEAASIPYGESFILVGGKDYTFWTDTDRKFKYA